MKVSEAFLVNTKNFEPIIETLVKYDAEEIVINSDLLETLSYSDPNDLLVVRILKDLRIIDNDGKPDIYFEEFHNAQTTKRALAKGLLTAYEGIFEKDSKAHHNSPAKIKEIFEEHFRGQKTDLIIKYISSTFEKIVSYVGASTIDAVQSNDSSMNEAPKSETTDKSASEQTKKIAQAAHADNHSSNGEEISDNNIDDFLSEFEISDSSNNASNTEQAEQEESSPTEQDEDLSVQEFLKSFEEADGKEKDSNESHTEEDVSEVKDNKTTNSETIDQPTSESNLMESSDVDPVDLQLPMSMASKTSENMNNVTAEQNFVQKALIRKSDLLHKMNRWEELVPTLETIIERYDHKQNTDFQGAVERAIIRRAIALLKLGHTEKALPALNSVIDRFKDSDNKEFYEQASRAMLYKVSILEKKDPLNDQLLPLYNSIIDRLESSSEILINEKLDEIHCKRFDLIVERDNDKSLILDASTKLIDRFKDNTKYRGYLQKAMIIRAEMLDEMNQDEAALKAYDQFLEYFGDQS